eukprot:1981758-Alexandrium_andersonii.AAC.1
MASQSTTLPKRGGDSGDNDALLAWRALTRARRCNTVTPQSAGICNTARRCRRIGRRRGSIKSSSDIGGAHCLRCRQGSKAIAGELSCRQPQPRSKWGISSIAACGEAAAAKHRRQTARRAKVRPTLCKCNGSCC